MIVGAPNDCKVIAPQNLQATTTTTPNGVATTILILGDDGNLYINQYQSPSLNPNELAKQPWVRLQPIVVKNDDAGYLFPNTAGPNVINLPYETFDGQAATATKLNQQKIKEPSKF